ncbi:hypothetical protein ETH_00037390 [Eimeria tenella]|uniref:Uncharacterized protein n=1 Tax=Eimeria tenella TaxID=5802 RepID=U6KRT5_EIMTE|nr:hypothetical protein ETH_00037390 [Eimeria tenella]CDJ40832.1 hypothetical protein ETH_00037390 [Eimeria tenella]|eukprot:XP_013231582.1 hypothetical protein ETH_00037390 [Eimeria tenella]
MATQFPEEMDGEGTAAAAAADAAAAASAGGPAAAAAAAYFIAAISQELDVEGVRVLNHFLDSKQDYFTFTKEGGGRDPETLR